jgi:hypothetical protein
MAKRIIDNFGMRETKHQLMDTNTWQAFTLCLGGVARCSVQLVDNL